MSTVEIDEHFGHSTREPDWAADEPPLPDDPEPPHEEWAAAADESSPARAESWMVTPEEIEREARLIRIREGAKAKIAREKRAAGDSANPLVIATADQLRLRLPVQTAPRVVGVLPANGSAVLIAPAGVGKTTLLANLTRDLLDGTPFLGMCNVTQLTGRVVILSYEMDPGELLDWLDTTGVDLTRVVVLDLRGRRNPLADDDERQDLAARLRALDAQVVLIDTFGRAFTGDSQDSAADVTAWWLTVEAFVRDAGASEWITSVHAGWKGERARGSSALHDAPDAVLIYTRDDDDRRWLHAAKYRGRGPLPKTLVGLDPDTLRLTIDPTAVDAGQAKIQRYVDAVVDFVAHHTGCSQNAIKTGVSGNDSAVLAAIKTAVATGAVVRTRTSNGWEHNLPEVVPALPQNTLAPGVVPGASIEAPPQPSTTQSSTTRNGADQ